MPAYYLPTNPPTLLLQQDGATNGSTGAPADGAFLKAYVPVLLGVGLLIGVYMLLSERDRPRPSAEPRERFRARDPCEERGYVRAEDCPADGVFRR